MLWGLGKVLSVAVFAVWAAGSLAAPITEYSYRYEFDVISSDIFWPAGSIFQKLTGGVNETQVTDTTLADSVGDMIHPLRGGIGQTGRHVIELSKKTDYLRNPDGSIFAENGVAYADDDQWLELTCLSGFICNEGWLSPTFRNHVPDADAAASGVHLYGNALDWIFQFDGAGGGSLRFDGDEQAEGSETVEINGMTYFAQADAQGLFQFAKVTVTRLDAPGQFAQPVSMPLPSSAWLMIAALGGTAAFARRRART